MSNLNQDKQVSSIFRTTNYDKYKVNSLQRMTKESHVKNLMESMEKNGFLPNKAISVNEKNEIIDGHHRYFAAKKLGIPALIQVCKGMDSQTIIESNQYQKEWLKDDFIQTYVKQGNPNYIAIVDLKNKFPKTTTTNALMLLLNSPNGHPKTEDFQKGNFKVVSIKKAEELAEKLEIMSKYYPNARHSKCLAALICCVMKCEGFIFNDFIKKLSKFPTIFKPAIKLDEYLKSFEEVYNYKRDRRYHVKLSYLSKEFPKK
jgi:hypothetical protein